MLKRAQLAAAAAVDRVVHKVALSRSAASRSRSRAESMGPTERLKGLNEIAAFYQGQKDQIFVDPPKVAFETKETSLDDGGRRIDLRWQSPHRSLDPETRTRLDDDARNRTALARLYLGHGQAKRPRPLVMLFHGYLGGQLAFEERAFSVPFLRERGLDVALFVLPFHGARGEARRPRFPASDPRFSIEGFRQAILDARTLVRHLEEEHGTETVGAMGMSLGGYTSALLGTVEPHLRFVAPMIPLASIADFAAADGRYVGTATQQREQHEAIERVYSVVSPLGRPVLVPEDGRLVIAARADRITPPEHAEKLAAHFGSQVHYFDGGHLLQVGRGSGFGRLLRMLEDLDLIPKRRR